MNTSAVEILLIEDDPDDAALTLYNLRKFNLINRIRHIDDGEKALDFLSSSSPGKLPGLILLDLKMPRVDGIQILQHIRSSPDKRDVLVIALVATLQGKKYVESFGLRADAYLVKPVEYLNFSRVISEIGISSVIVQSPVQSPG